MPIPFKTSPALLPYDTSSVKKVTPEGLAPYSPISILMQNEYFHALYYLLDLDSPTKSLKDQATKPFKTVSVAQKTTAEQVWELLHMLPINEALAKKFRQAASTYQSALEWADLIESEHIYKLIYNLQIVKKLLYDIPGWGAQFEESGGVDHILSVELKLRFTALEPGQWPCFALLLQIISFFVTEEGHAVHKTYKSPASSQAPPFQASPENRKPSAQHSEPRMQFLPGAADLPSHYRLREEALSHVNMEVFVQSILEACWHSADPQYFSSELVGVPCSWLSSSVDIIRYGTRLLVACCSSSEGSLMYLFEYPKLTEWLKRLLLQTQSEHVRKEVASGLVQLCLKPSSTSQTLRDRACSLLLPILLELLEDIQKNSGNSAQFFSLLDRLVKRDSQLTPQEVMSLFGNLVSLMSHPSFEATGAPCRGGSSDNVVKGLMGLVRTLLIKQAYSNAKLKISHRLCKQLISSVYSKYLFALPSLDDEDTQPPSLCKTKESRESAFRLLIELARRSTSNFIYLHDLVCQQLKALHTDDRWQIAPSSSQKSASGYIGLQNQGATCYMNSLVQQLYHVVPFRTRLLALSPPSCGAAHEKGDSEQLSSLSEAMKGKTLKSSSFDDLVHDEELSQTSKDRDRVAGSEPVKHSNSKRRTKHRAAEEHRKHRKTSKSLSVSSPKKVRKKGKTKVKAASPEKEESSQRDEGIKEVDSLSSLSEAPPSFSSSFESLVDSDSDRTTSSSVSSKVHQRTRSSPCSADPKTSHSRTLSSLPDSGNGNDSERRAEMALDKSSSDPLTALKDNVLFQLQYLFTFLNCSNQRYYDTTPFCQALKDYDGEALNTAQQMDANEFFNMLFDKLGTSP